MTAHIASGRMVFTYQLDGWPAAVLTGYEDAGGFVLEHVIVWRARLLSALHAGLAEAVARHYRHIRFGLPRAFPLAGKLSNLARRLGFCRYAKDETCDYFVRWLR